MPIVALLKRAEAADLAFVVYRSAGRGFCWDVVSHTGQDPVAALCVGDVIASESYPGAGFATGG